MGGGALGSSAVLFLLASREVHFPMRAPALGLRWCSLSQPGGALGDPQALGYFSHVLAAASCGTSAQNPGSAGYPATQAPALWARTPLGFAALGVSALRARRSSMCLEFLSPFLCCRIPVVGREGRVRDPFPGTPRSRLLTTWRFVSSPAGGALPLGWEVAPVCCPLWWPLPPSPGKRSKLSTVHMGGSI